ncbi:MAG TPA: hypothetical protein PKJ37_10550 [Acidobacteriota bacterium]|nr:hypothetical protein [Acidobacteriota bacterium]HNT18316.1 hypothetical protein [Acidobacteriota bacterium]
MVDLTPQEKQKIYAEEKVRLEAQERLKAEAEQKKSGENVTGCSVLIIIAIAAVILFFMFDCGKNNDAPTAKSDTYTANGLKSPGYKGKLYSSAAQTTLVAVDKKVLSELTRTLSSHDETGYYELLLSGKVYEVDNNTSVLILQTQYGAYEVRILEGERKNEKGWVFDGNLK